MSTSLLSGITLNILAPTFPEKREEVFEEMEKTMWYSLVTAQESATGALTARVRIHEDSSWFSGHFPDNPILPGIAQLKIVADIIGGLRHEDLLLSGLSRVKFRRIVRPGEILVLQAEAGVREDHYIFRITGREGDVCSGTMILARKQDTSAL